MTLLEKLEIALPFSEQWIVRKGVADENRYAYFDPFTLTELREVIAALRTVAGQQ